MMVQEMIEKMSRISKTNLTIKPASAIMPKSEP